MNITWEDIAPSICTSCAGTCDAANQGPDNKMSAARFMEQHGCESKEVYEAAERVATYVNDLARLQEEGWKRAQALLAEHRRRSPDFQKLKAWWSDDKNWFVLFSDDGINQTTISLTVDEASVLSGNAEPPIEKIPSAEARAERLARDIAAPPSPDREAGWQPIETAPPEFPPVLLMRVVDFKGMKKAAWVRSGCYRAHHADGYVKAWREWIGGEAMVDRLEPTHWRELDYDAITFEQVLQQRRENNAFRPAPPSNAGEGGK